VAAPSRRQGGADGVAFAAVRGEVFAVIGLTGVHLVGFVLLAIDVWSAPPRSAPDEGEDGGNGGLPRRPSPPQPPPRSQGPPLPDAEPGSRRLRAPGRLADAYERVPRRGDREPDPVPVPARR